MQDTPENRIRQAQAALRNAMTRAAKHDDPAAKAATLLQGIITAMRWLDGSHEALEADPGTPG
jgi:hypothetical protein